MLAAAAVLALSPLRAAGDAPSPAALREELRQFGICATVLHVAAHPDDENTQLITYLARGRGYRTGYLSLTRGDGGQNEIGPEFGARLGVARTQELLAARRLDGGRQFFSRAMDFGYSKSVDETLAFWDREEVIGDAVRVIREFRPDVIITRFSPEPGGTHGHHTASAVVALEAFRRAGDPKAYPGQIAAGLTPWQPKRILHNGGRGGGSLTLQAGGDDAVTGESFQAIAMRSRAQHRTQGFGLRPAGSGPWQESFRLLDGPPAAEDLMDGVDTTWNRVPGGAEIARLGAEALAKFDPKRPSASVPALLELRKLLAKLPADPLVADKRRQLDRLVQRCLGLTVHSIAAVDEVVPGETLAVHSRIGLGAAYPVRLRAVRIPGLAESAEPAELSAGQTVTRKLSLPVPKSQPVTQPYWLQQEPAAGMFRVADARLIGQPENPPAFPVEYELEAGGQAFVITGEVVGDGRNGRPERALAVIAPVSLRFGSGVALFAPGATKAVEVVATAARDGSSGTVRLDVPAGWKAVPASRPVQFSRAGDDATLAFSVTAPDRPDSGTLSAVADVGGVQFSHRRIEIRYAHIPVQLLQPAASLKVAAFDVATRGRTAGYLPGAGDDTAEALAQLGYRVTTLTGADLTEPKLRGLDVVVIGVRAFNERQDLEPGLSGLLAYVEAGGTVVVQYNRPNGLKGRTLGPYPLSIEGPAPQLRVTHEDSPVSFALPEHPALNTPNRIGPGDFAGWVQERGAYFPSSWDTARYDAVLAMNDPGEEPLKGSVLIARHGRGHFVYTGLAFFRQLPAGVPGAYRLFANLLSLGK